MLATLSAEQFQILVTAIGVLVASAWQSWLKREVKVETDKIHSAVEIAAEKRDQTTETVNKILVDVNSQSTADKKAINECNAREKVHEIRIAGLEEQLRSIRQPPTTINP